MKMFYLFDFDELYFVAAFCLYLVLFLFSVSNFERFIKMSQTHVFFYHNSKGYSKNNLICG